MHFNEVTFDMCGSLNAKQSCCIFPELTSSIFLCMILCMIDKWASLFNLTKVIAIAVLYIMVIRHFVILVYTPDNDHQNKDILHVSHNSSNDILNIYFIYQM